MRVRACPHSDKRDIMHDAHPNVDLIGLHHCIVVLVLLLIGKSLKPEWHNWEVVLSFKNLKPLVGLHQISEIISEIKVHFEHIDHTFLAQRQQHSDGPQSSVAARRSQMEGTPVLQRVPVSIFSRIRLVSQQLVEVRVLRPEEACALPAPEGFMSVRREGINQLNIV
eukprot:CAMPEP_0168353358 /NCGR_PEP_ID=MMETSP0213-20121227/23201_1 /TAXON_ID=151035 /ORGANISM="Euplotes harpa, Strain FSP1.4" /LENGTH=166 /DNA_ID=CAMNT_0008364949 /DNA_START=78 /DNA_END=578 /DNA_ORIENTATION=+